jgi:hypothetical protein
MPRRKHTDSSTDKPTTIKRKRGRPPKAKAPPPQAPKKARGRPAKPKAAPLPEPKKPRGRPPKAKVVAPTEPKKPRGRPPKAKPAPRPEPKKPKTNSARIKVAVTPKEPKKSQGRPARAEVVVPGVKSRGQVDDGKTPQERLIEQHTLYPAALWIEKRIAPMEEAYLRKTARRHGLTLLQTIMDHMLGYFSVRGTDLEKALKESKKYTQQQ